VSALWNEKSWHEPAAERVVLGQPGSRTNERLWGSRAPEREVLGQPGSRTGGSGGLLVSGLFGLQRAGSRTCGSGSVADASAQWNVKLWREQAAEQVILGQPGSRTSGCGAAGLQNERFWGGRALERAVLAGCRFQDGLVCSWRAPERVVLALGLARALQNEKFWREWQQNELFWGGWVLERVVLGQLGSRTRGSGAAGL
jgi:hypothetical protein